MDAVYCRLHPPRPRWPWSLPLRHRYRWHRVECAEVAGNEHPPLLGRPGNVTVDLSGPRRVVTLGSDGWLMVGAACGMLFVHQGRPVDVRDTEPQADRCRVCWPDAARSRRPRRRRVAVLDGQ